MSEASEQALAARLSKAKRRIVIGCRYKHYKNRLYKVVAIALNEETLEPCVVYQAEYGEELTWIRPAADWSTEIQWEGKTVPRFTKI